MRRALAFAFLCCVALTAQAQMPLRPFVSGSLAAIEAAQGGRPFLLSFWSVDCAPCRAELAQLARLARAHPQLTIVLVSTDPPGAAEDVQAVLDQYAPAWAERWIFADPFSERLRFEVDPRWHGELPRSYLYGPGGRVEGISGPIDPQRLAAWLKSVLGVLHDGHP
ncbi:TlpA family protein disulfide reductase [Thiobacter aerophilum]|uniref:TlpA disulfide reductase family protein n=1 Tax=Thiobacter aerophilum TaxID=3121275 RepID=A0ABV0EF09_9BURK